MAESNISAFDLMFMSFMKELQPFNRIRAYVVIILIPIFAVFSVFANTLVVIVFFRNRSRWVKTHVYYFAMSASDLCAMIFSGFTTAFNTAFPYFIKGYVNSIFNPNKTVTGCIISQLGYFLSGIKFSCLILLSFDRLWAIFAPFHYRIHSSLTFPIILVAIIIVVNTVISLPPLFHLTADVSFPLLMQKYVCAVFSDQIFMGDWFLFYRRIYGFGAPHLLLTVCVNTIIAIKLFLYIRERRRMLTYTDKTNASTSGIVMHELTRTKIFLVMLAIHLCFDLPSNIGYIWVHHEMRSSFSDMENYERDLLNLSIVEKYFSYLVTLTYVPVAVNTVFYILEASFLRRQIREWMARIRRRFSPSN